MMLRLLAILQLLTASAMADSLDPRKWDIGPTIGGHNYSSDENGGPIAKKDEREGWSFRIPKAPGEVDYVTTGCKNISRAKTIRLTYDLIGDGKLKATEGPFPARIRLHIQRKGDNWSGNGKYEHYRFWSVAYVDLVEGKGQILEAPLDDHTLWTGVYGQPNQSGFRGATKNCGRVGVTFGGIYAGHGVRLRSGEATFVIREFQIH